MISMYIFDGLGSFLSGCLMQLAKYTIHNHCLFSLSATRVTTLWLKQPTLFLLCRKSIKTINNCLINSRSSCMCKKLKIQKR